MHAFRTRSVLFLTFENRKRKLFFPTKSQMSSEQYRQDAPTGHNIQQLSGCFMGKHPNPNGAGRRIRNDQKSARAGPTRQPLPHKQYSCLKTKGIRYPIRLGNGVCSRWVVAYYEVRAWRLLEAHDNYCQTISRCREMKMASVGICP